MSEISLSDCNPKIREFFTGFIETDRELNKLDKILTLIKENKDLFSKHDFELKLSFRGEKII